MFSRGRPLPHSLGRGTWLSPPPPPPIAPRSDDRGMPDLPSRLPPHDLRGPWAASEHVRVRPRRRRTARGPWWNVSAALLTRFSLFPTAARSRRVTSTNPRHSSFGRAFSLRSVSAQRRRSHQTIAPLASAEWAHMGRQCRVGTRCAPRC